MIKYKKLAQQIIPDINWLQRNIGKYFPKWKWLWKKKQTVYDAIVQTNVSRSKFKTYIYESRFNRYQPMVLEQIEKECKLIGKLPSKKGLQLERNKKYYLVIKMN